MDVALGQAEGEGHTALRKRARVQASGYRHSSVTLPCAASVTSVCAVKGSVSRVLLLHLNTPCTPCHLVWRCLQGKRPKALDTWWGGRLAATMPVRSSITVSPIIPQHYNQH